MNEITEQILEISRQLQALYLDMSARLTDEHRRRTRPKQLQQLHNQQRALMFDLERTMRMTLEAGVAPELCEEVVRNLCQSHEQYVMLLRSKVQALEVEAVKASRKKSQLRSYANVATTSSAA